MLSPSNTNRIAPCESPCLSQYAVINFLSGVFLFILKCTTLPSYLLDITYKNTYASLMLLTWPVTFKLMCSLLPRSGFTSACQKTTMIYSILDSHTGFDINTALRSHLIFVRHLQTALKDLTCSARMARGKLARKEF